MILIILKKAIFYVKDDFYTSEEAFKFRTRLKKDGLDNKPRGSSAASTAAVRSCLVKHPWHAAV